MLLTNRKSPRSSSTTAIRLPGWWYLHISATHHSDALSPPHTSLPRSSSHCICLSQFFPPSLCSLSFILAWFIPHQPFSLQSLLVSPADLSLSPDLKCSCMVCHLQHLKLKPGVEILSLSLHLNLSSFHSSHYAAFSFYAVSKQQKNSTEETLNIW